MRRDPLLSKQARMLSALYVAIRIIANPVSNVFQKQLTARSASPVLIIASTHALLALACLPALPAISLRLPASFWGNIGLCALLAVASNVLLVHALESSDLSVLGPVNAYKSIVSLALGVFLIGEVPTARGLAGVVLIVAGSSFIVDRDPDQPRLRALAAFFGDRGVQFRFAALILSATEAVFLKRAILAASPLAAFIFWSILGLPIGGAAAAWLLGPRLREQFALLRRHARTYLWLGLSTGAMQLTTLLAFGRLQVGYSLALFQLSALLSVLLGHRFFQEGHLARRLAGSGVMVAGAALIVVFGRG
jgi:drug/metabolite transporter (DMT)-like permease